MGQSKKIRIMSKKIIEKTRLVIFALKIITFIKSENIGTFFEQLLAFLNQYNDDVKN